MGLGGGGGPNEPSASAAEPGQPQSNRVLCLLVLDSCPGVQEGQHSDMDKQSPDLLLIINEAMNESACYYCELSRDPGLYSKCCKVQKKEV